MTIYKYILLAGFLFFSLSFCYHCFRVILYGKLKDPSKATGKSLPAVFYAFTVAMSPLKKETAKLHFPTYFAGIFYHMGSFLSYFIVAIYLFHIKISGFLLIVSSIFIATALFCGIALLIKRVIDRKMRYFSNPDDYFSNILVTGFQGLTLTTLFYQAAVPFLFLYSGLLFLYIPAGKLRHVIYFAAARIYLGLFYGKRGTWPSKGKISWE
jgi:hypothetical protein